MREFFAPPPPPADAKPGCGCQHCYRGMPVMILCQTCGNKRCPKATHHDNACTNSNAPGQPGSSYGPAAMAGLPAQQGE